jgi:hypothetical protein
MCPVRCVTYVSGRSQQVTGCCPKNLNAHSGPHFTAAAAYPLPAPSDIPPAPPVFYRCRPGCTDRASSESSRDAGFPARSSVRSSPCSPANCLGCDASCEARIGCRTREISLQYRSDDDERLLPLRPQLDNRYPEDLVKSWARMPIGSIRRPWWAQER